MREMTQIQKRAVFKKVLKKAEKNGYKDHINLLPAFHRVSEKQIYWLLFSQLEKIVFSKKFASAFWGDEPVCMICGLSMEAEIDDDKEFQTICSHSDPRYQSPYRPITAWEYHLQQLVFSKNISDPILYLRDFV